MPKVTFKFDIVKDSKTYYDAVNKGNAWGYDFSNSVKPEVKNMLKGKSWDKVKVKLGDMLKKGYKEKEKEQNSLAKKIEGGWRKVEKRYFTKLEKVTKRKIYHENFTAFFVTIGRCPYYPKEHGFAVSLFGKETNLTIAHEIMHLQFHHYFEDKITKEIGENKFQDLKEALTELLNIEFKNVILGTDLGYPNHKQLREFISKSWKEEKDFDVLLNKCIKYLKEK